MAHKTVKGFERWAILQLQESIFDMDATVWIDADEIRIKGGMVNLR